MPVRGLVRLFRPGRFSRRGCSCVQRCQPSHAHALHACLRLLGAAAVRRPGRSAKFPHRGRSSTVRAGAANPAARPPLLLLLLCGRHGPMCPPPPSSRDVPGRPDGRGPPDGMRAARRGRPGQRLPPASAAPRHLVVYRAYWQNVSFPTPMEPRAVASPRRPAESTSATPRLVVLAPARDPELQAAPTSLVVLRSRSRSPRATTPFSPSRSTTRRSPATAWAAARCPRPRPTSSPRSCSAATSPPTATTPPPARLTPNPSPDAGAACDGGS